MDQDKEELIFKALSKIHKETKFLEQGNSDIGTQIDKKLGEIQSEKYD